MQRISKLRAAGSSMYPELRSKICSDGYMILPAIFTQAETDALRNRLRDALAAAADGNDLLRSQNGLVYGARNLLRVFPEVRELTRNHALAEVLTEVLGEACGLVRGLYFDKPPGESWSLAWHRDLTIAVKDNTLPSQQLRKPTMKAGLPHLEAPREILEQMLTLRIHLDDVTPDNGPLKVIVRSHLHDKDALTESQEAAHEMRDIIVQRGDVLAMRPRIIHGSIGASPGTKVHRRIIHLEFASSETLPDGFQWADFVRVQ